jgi:potassium channel subfamily K
MGARITEKRRANAVHDVDDRKQTIQVSWFAQADFSTDPSLSPAQRREEEFQVMRTVQAAAELERRYFALCTSLAFVAMVWLLGAMVFMLAEHAQRQFTVAA